MAQVYGKTYSKRKHYPKNSVYKHILVNYIHAAY